ncbi:hypothetical protein M1O13_00335 [Dehalococcoidia bacterium]|nr:hypothetical protein [Dehalococcoidia bacterium]
MGDDAGDLADEPLQSPPAQGLWPEAGRDSLEIDNGINGTDYSIGFDLAITVVTEALLHTTGFCPGGHGA